MRSSPCLRGTKKEKGGTGNRSEYSEYSENSEYSEYSEYSENSEYSEPHLQSVFRFPFSVFRSQQWCEFADGLAEEFQGLFY